MIVDLLCKNYSKAKTAKKEKEEEEINETDKQD